MPTWNGLKARLKRSRPFAWYLNGRASLLTRLRMRRAFENSESYRDYLYAQIRRSFPLAGATDRPEPRTENLVSLMGRHLPPERERFEVLCVGCRDGRELDYVEKTCGVRTAGLDLFSVDARIQVGDMHAMGFEDNRFDALYSCHNLEHSYEPERAIREMVRVVKPGSLIVIETPVDFAASATDRWDAGSVDGLLAAFGSNVGEVLFREESERHSRGLRKKDARILFRVEKARTPSAALASASSDHHS